MNTRDWYLNGYRDALNAEPWRHAPISWDQWTTNPTSDPRDAAYWQGFDAGCTANLAAATRER